MLTTYEFAKLFFPDKFDIKPCQMQMNFLNDVYKSTSVIAPRGHGKTFIHCVINTIYIAIMQQFKYILIIQSTKQKTTNIMNTIRAEFESNELLRRAFGNYVSKEWGGWSFVLKNGVIFQGASLRSSLRGQNKYGLRPDYIIADDLYDDKTQKNSDLLQEVEEWFKKTVYNLPANPLKAVFKVMGTKFHQLDIFTGLRRSETFDSQTYKAILDDGTPMWKEKYSIGDLNAIKRDLGELIFDQEYQGIPIDDTKAVVSAEDIHYTSETNFSGVYICSIDPAITEKSSSDYTGIVIGKTDSKGNSVIIETHNVRMRTAMLLEFIAGLHNEYRFDFVSMEAVSGFIALYDMVVDLLDCPVHQATPKSCDKHQRFAQVQPFFNKGQIKFKEGVESVKMLTEQMLEFPNSKHDDLVDAVVYFANSLYKVFGRSEKFKQ